MTESHALRALRKKRAEMAGELAQIELHRRSLTNKIRQMDAAIRIMGGGQTAPLPHGRRRRWVFRRGELQRLVLAILRESGGEIDNAAIARVIVARMDWDTGDAELCAFIAGKVKDVRKRSAKVTAGAYASRHVVSAG